MRARPRFDLICAGATIALLFACDTRRDAPATVPLTDDSAPSNVYEDGPPTADGIGRRYFGREIAQVMGHPAIYWLQRNTREAEERTDLLMTALQLRDGLDVADIGSGSGYFTIPLARAIGPSGTAYGVDIQPEMIEFLSARARVDGIGNISPILSRVDDVCLAQSSVDLILLVDAYHEFDHPHEMLQSIVRSLRHDGRVALVEYRGEDPEVPIKPLHKMTEAQARIELEAAGLVFERNDSVLPLQHLLWFRKPSP